MCTHVPVPLWQRGTLHLEKPRLFQQLLTHMSEEECVRAVSKCKALVCDCDNTVVNETFPKCFRNVFVPVLDLVSKNAIFGKLKALSPRGYMTHTLVLENSLAAKWNRHPWSTQLEFLGV